MKTRIKGVVDGSGDSKSEMKKREEKIMKSDTDSVKRAKGKSADKAVVSNDKNNKENGKNLGVSDKDSKESSDISGWSYEESCEFYKDNMGMNKQEATYLDKLLGQCIADNARYSWSFEEVIFRNAVKENFNIFENPRQTLKKLFLYALKVSQKGYQERNIERMNKGLKLGVMLPTVFYKYSGDVSKGYEVLDNFTNAYTLELCLENLMEGYVEFQEGFDVKKFKKILLEAESNHFSLKKDNPDGEVLEENDVVYLLTLAYYMQQYCKDYKKAKELLEKAGKCAKTFWQLCEVSEFYIGNAIGENVARDYSLVDAKKAKYYLSRAYKLIDMNNESESNHHCWLGFELESLLENPLN